MDSLTFTINLKDLDACEGDFDQVVEAIQNFINILHCASPDYYLAGDVLQKQLDTAFQAIVTNYVKDCVARIQKRNENLADKIKSITR